MQPNTSDDFMGLLRHRHTADVPATVGFYDRAARSFETVGQDVFLDRAAGTAATLELAGLTAGDHAAIVAATPQALWRGFLGAVLAGVVPVLVPVRPSLDTESDIADKLRGVADALPSAHLVVQHTSNGACINAPDDAIAFSLSDGPGDALDRLDRLTGDPDRPLHLQFTSGSTGVPKPVVLTHRNVMESAAMLNERTGAGPGDHVVSWLPLYHDMGLVGMAMLALGSGADLKLLSPFDFLSDPMNWLSAIAESPGAITAAPNFAFDYTVRRVSDAARDRLDLSTWKKCYCGAEPVDATTVARFIERFRPAGLAPQVVHPTYGLAEATLMVTMPHSGESPKQLRITRDSVSPGGPVTVVSQSLIEAELSDPDAEHPTVTCLGAPAAGLQVAIVDPAGEAVRSENQCGEVVVSGPTVSPGYLRPDGSMTAFAGRRCATGDVGFMHGGELYLVERLKSMLIINGQNHSAGALERVLASRLAVPLDSCVVLQRSIVDGDARVIAVIEAPRGASPDQLLHGVETCIRAEELPINDVVIVRRGTLPRTTSGKKQPAQLRSALANGSVEALAESSITVAATEVEVAEVEVAEVDEAATIDLDRVNDAAIVLGVIEAQARRRGWAGIRVEEDDRLVADLGLDSLAMVELSIEIEERLGRGLAEEQLALPSTAGDVARLVTETSQPSVQVSDLLRRLVNDVPQVYRRVSAQRDRQLLIDGRWISDFASLNYLGLDLCPEVIEAVAPAVRTWGVHPSWTRAVASPQLYHQLEQQLAALTGANDVMVFPTISLLHFGVLPKLVGPRDTLIVDHGAHNSLHEAAELTHARGAALLTFDHRAPDTLVTALRAARGRAVVALNGVYSMTGAVPDLAALHEIAVAHGALLYLDDAHGFGILGDRPTSLDPYGRGGGGVVRHAGLDYDHIVYVGGLSKAFSSMAAFITCRDPEHRALFETASTSIFSGPVPTASMASALAGLAVNAREGDDRRRVLHQLTSRLIAEVSDRGYQIDNDLAFPVVNLATGAAARTIRASQIMWDHGVLFTPSVFPAAPLDAGGFRISLTVDNTHEEIDALLRGLDAVSAELGEPPRQYDQRLLPSQ